MNGGMSVPMLLPRHDFANSLLLGRTVILAPLAFPIFLPPSFCHQFFCQLFGCGFLLCVSLRLCVNVRATWKRLISRPISQRLCVFVTLLFNPHFPVLNFPVSIPFPEIRDNSWNSCLHSLVLYLCPSVSIRGFLSSTAAA